MESELPLRDQHNQLFIPFEEIETVYNLNESNERWDQSKNILHALTMNEILYNLFRLITDREYLQHKKQALEEMFGSEEEHGEAGKIRDYAILHRETSDALIWALELDVRAKKDLEEITNQQKEKKKLFYKYLGQLHNMISNKKNMDYETNFREGEDWETIVENIRKYYGKYCDPHHRESNKKI